MGQTLLRRYFIMARDAPKEAPTLATAAFEVPTLAKVMLPMRCLHWPKQCSLQGVPTLAKVMLPMRCLHWPKQCSLQGAYTGQSDGAYTSKNDDPYEVPTLAKGMHSLQ